MCARTGLAFGGLGLAGSYAGSRLSAGVEPDVLLVGFAALLLVAAAGMLRRGATDRRGVSPRPWDGTDARRRPRPMPGRTR